MKKKLAIILCIVMMISVVPTTTVFGASKISISPKSMTLAVGDIAQLNVSNAKGKLTWKTSDKTIATVTSKGVVQGKAKGTVTITVKDSKKKTTKCEVTVKEYAETDDEGIFEKIKDKIIELIKSFTYSKSEIDEKISSSSGGTTIINQCDCASELTTSGNVPLRRGQTTTFESNGHTYTITSVNVTKEAYNKKYTEDGTDFFYPYKYHIKIVGTTDHNYLYGELCLMNKFGAEEPYEINTAYGNVVINEGVFTYEADHFSNVNASELAINVLGDIG